MKNKYFVVKTTWNNYQAEKTIAQEDYCWLRFESRTEAEEAAKRCDEDNISGGFYLLSQNETDRPSYKVVLFNRLPVLLREEVAFDDKRMADWDRAKAA